MTDMSNLGYSENLMDLLSLFLVSDHEGHCPGLVLSPSGIKMNGIGSFVTSEVAWLDSKLSQGHLDIGTGSSC